jgi:hypothetical protein
MARRPTEAEGLSVDKRAVVVHLQLARYHLRQREPAKSLDEIERVLRALIPTAWRGNGRSRS